MALDRKGLRLALRDALQARMTAAGDPKEFLTVDVNPRNLSPGRLPVLVIEAADETPEVPELTQRPVWHLSFDVTIYVRPEGASPDPDADLDVLLAHLEAALEKQADETFAGWWTNLGGRCSRAYPSGTARRFQDETGNAWAVMPIEIVAPTRTAGVPA